MAYSNQDLGNFQNVFASGDPNAIRALLAQNSPGINFSDSDIAMLANQSRADRGDLVSPYGSSGAPGFTSYLSANRDPTGQELTNQAISQQFAHQGDLGPVLRQAIPAFAGAIGTGGLSTFGQAARDITAPSGPTYQGGPSYSSGGAMPNYRYGTNDPTVQPSGLFDNLLGTVGNLSPAILAGYLGNSQRQDVMGQVGRLNDVAGSLSGPAFMQSITNPYDLQTGQGRTALSQSLQQRGVGGSSFGNQQLGNYDYQRGLGRGDLATRAAAGVAGTQGQLYSDALRGIVGGNAAYNSLLGAGLGASGSIFNRGSGNPLAGLIGGISGGLGGIGGSLGGAWNGLFGNGTDPTTDPYAGNPGGQVDFGNDPSLGLPDSTSGNGLFDWLNQNGGSYGINF